MASFVIEGGHKLCGEIIPQGAKNEVLQIICATLLTSEEVIVSRHIGVDFFHSKWQDWCPKSKKRIRTLIS